MHTSSDNPVVETYSRLAVEYDSPENLSSCWGRVTQDSVGFLEAQRLVGAVVDVGCGAGRELARLASESPSTQFVGVEPADNLRALASARTDQLGNVRVLDGRFESLPLENGSVDYLYSILAFHWTTDLEGSVAELGRVLAPGAAMDLAFIGRHNGREFIQTTTPVFFKFMSPAAMVKAATLRKQLTVEEATALFEHEFGSRVSVTESYHTYYDTLEGHWAWWVRIEGQLVDIAEEKKHACDEAVRAALATLETDEGIPYTVHLLHVQVRP